MHNDKKILIVEDLDRNGNNFQNKKYSMTFGGGTPHKNLGILVNGGGPPEAAIGPRSSGVSINGGPFDTTREIKNIVV